LQRFLHEAMMVADANLTRWRFVGV